MIFSVIKIFFLICDMRKIIYLLLIAILPLMGSAFLEYFSAKSETGKVKLEWKTGTERNTKEFIIERRPVNGSFMNLKSVSPKGDNSYYMFYDDSALKTNSVVFTYRLKIVDYDNSVSYSKEISVSHQLSDVKRTWGSIKAMFR